MYDLILQNGIVYDQGTGLAGAKRDIAIEAGRIALVAERVDPALAAEVRDIAGQMVSAGWIDLHVHVYGGLGLRDVQSVGVRAGATTVIDAGDFGTATFEDFDALRQDSIADVYGFIHMHPNGIPYTGLARADYRTVHVGAIIELAERRPDVIKGIKLGALGDLPFHNLRICKVIADTAGIPYFMHLGEVNKAPAKMNITREAIDLMGPGDIITHIYTNDHGRILEEDGRLIPEIVAARDRGVIFDIGNGVGNFSYDIAARAADQGILPHTISSDQNSLCARVRSDLPSTLSRMLIVGMSIEDIIERVTIAPARTLGLDGSIGSLTPGHKADLTIFRLEEHDGELLDADNVGRPAKRIFVADHVYKDGVRHQCDVESVYRGGNFVMRFAEPEQLDKVRLDTGERAFLGRLLAALEKTPDWRGDTVQGILDKVIAKDGIERKKALNALYRLILAEDSFGFTPQVGCMLGRLGADGIASFRKVA